MCKMAKTKIRDSGMPAEAYWESLFDVPLILDRLRVSEYNNVAELGCGYGTFSIPVADAIAGTLYTFDVDSAMIARTRQRRAGRRIVCEERDVMSDGFGVSADAALLFNILHCEEPQKLLRHAAESAPDVLVIHWRYGDTPRGPDLSIRPRPEQIIDWAEEVGLRAATGVIDLPPWHFGLRFSRQ
jgi:SAM-dependent methyltransferase